MFREVDLDGDGWVTFPEFSQWWCERQQASKGKLDAALIAATPFKPINNAATPLRLDGSVSYAV